MLLIPDPGKMLALESLVLIHVLDVLRELNTVLPLTRACFLYLGVVVEDVPSLLLHLCVTDLW